MTTLSGDSPEELVDSRRRPVGLIEEDPRPRLLRWVPRLPSFPGGRAGLLILGFLILAALLFAFLRPSSPSLGSPVFTAVVPVSEVDPESGRSLVSSEFVLALAFGEPRELGPGGLPVVRHRDSGDVRELTPVEVAFFEEAGPDLPLFLPFEDSHIVWAPGPRGLGLWWDHDPLVEALSTRTVFDRRGWLRRQQAELQDAVNHVSYAVYSMTALEFDVWERGVSAHIYYPIEQLRSKHPLGAVHGQWAAVPSQWECDPALEAVVSTVVTNGCPPGSLAGAISEVWHRLGRLADQLHALGRYGIVLDNARMADMYNSGAVQQHAFAVLELEDDVQRFFISLTQLEEFSRGVGYPIFISRFQLEDGP